jgi:hypothetical protein
VNLRFRIALLETDFEVLVTVSDLEPYGIDIPDDYKEYEEGKRQSWPDGPLDMEYEYEQPEGGDGGVYIYCSAGERSRCSSTLFPESMFVV